MKTKNSSLPAMALLVLAGFVCLFNEAEMNIALIAISKLYGIEVATAQWLTTGYMLVTGTFMPLSAFAMGRLGSRKTVLYALTLLLIGIGISAFAPGFGMLLAGRLIQALGCAFFIPVMMAVIITLAPKEKLGTYNGVMMLVLMAAPALSPTIAGFILSSLGLSWMFYIIIPVLLAVIAALTVLLPDTIKPREATLDPASVALSILASAVWSTPSATPPPPGSPHPRRSYLQPWGPPL
ncbi:MFS transporter [Actinomyces ruminis]|uniref:MFS transporter n=1 Tax=Actinomyces ruminis TaxID=1937003 RepID=A0ABX4MEJ3_9ACTO|nr:MFS transporter [Actinomyces ruminis]PHP52522.1 MFS transporter [Actinomyces ruminis]